MIIPTSHSSVNIWGDEGLYHWSHGRCSNSCTLLLIITKISSNKDYGTFRIVCLVAVEQEQTMRWRHRINFPILVLLVSAFGTAGPTTCSGLETTRGSDNCREPWLGGTWSRVAGFSSLVSQ